VAACEGREYREVERARNHRTSDLSIHRQVTRPEESLSDAPLREAARFLCLDVPDGDDSDQRAIKAGAESLETPEKSPVGRSPRDGEGCLGAPAGGWRASSAQPSGTKELDKASNLS
jgi:hypothetical protein